MEINDTYIAIAKIVEKESRPYIHSEKEKLETLNINQCDFGWLRSIQAYESSKK